MKENSSVSKFLAISVKKYKSAPSHASEGHCEVIGLGADGLAKGFEDYRELFKKLQSSDEIGTGYGATCLVRFAGVRGAKHVLFVHLGKDKDGINALGPIERLRRLGAIVVKKLGSEKIKSADLYLDSFLSSSAKLSVDATEAAYALAEGMTLTSYSFKKYLKPSTKKEIISVCLYTSDAKRVAKIQKGVAQAEALVLGAEICRDLGNEPSNELYPAAFAAEAQKLAKEYGLKYTVLDEKGLEKEKMGLIIGVGQGSAHSPRLFMLDYHPAGSKRTLALVGKGVTFDSGGISIKSAGHMEDMKHDMCGAAAVVGAIVACAKLKLKVRIIAVVAAADNMPGSKAIQPGNILRSRAGKTVEIINTDAEGRLVLADALDYVQDMKPDYTIDLATLTGAITVALGRACAGLMGNDSKFIQMVKQAAKVSGERVWELPLYDEYFDELKSDCADLRNSGDSPANGVMKAAQFMHQFIRKDTKWAHLDIAAVAYNMSTLPYCPRKGSSGYGVRLLVNLAQSVG